MWDKLLFILILFLPFQFSIPLLPGSDIAIFRILIILFFLLLSLSLYKKGDKLGPPGWLIWLILSSLVILIAISIAPHLDWALRKGIFLVNFLLWYGALSFLLLNRKIHPKKIIKVIILSGTLIACIGILQWLSQFVFGLEQTLSFWREFVAPLFLGSGLSGAVIAHSSWLVNVGGTTIFRSIATFPDPHMFSFFLELCLPWAFFIFMKTKNKFFLFSFILILTALLLTFSRGAYIGLLVGVSIGFLVSMHRRAISLYEGLLLSTFLVLSIGILFGTENFIRDRLSDTFLSLDSSGEERLVLWGEASQVIQNSPLLGIGLGGFPEKVQPSATYRDPIYAHNLYLDIAVEMGLLGLIVWICGILWGVQRFLILGKENSIFFAGAISLIMFSTHGLFDTPLYSIHVLGLLCVVMALGWHHKQKICAK